MIEQFIRVYDQKDPFSEEVRSGVSSALQEIHTNFEVSPFENENLDYHNTNHAIAVARRAVHILTVARMADSSLVSDRDLQLAYFAGVFHDLVQHWFPQRIQDGEFEKVLRGRPMGENEKASAEKAVAFMEKANIKRGMEVFSKLDQLIVNDAIVGTSFVYEPSLKTVVQPSVTRTSPLVVRAIALADVNGVGMEGSVTALQDTDTLFKELNLDIKSALKTPTISAAYQRYYQQRILAWVESQAGFMSGRNKLVQRETEGFPQRVRRLFNRFDEGVLAVADLSQKRSKRNFRELVHDIYGTNLPNFAHA